MRRVIWGFSLQEIQENKRPEGTRLVPKAEQETVLRELWDRKKELSSGIEHMSVTLYTTRAQNQFRGYVQEMD